MDEIIWRVSLGDPPHILRPCPKCGAKTPYESSGRFRVNANGKRLDVWLVYRCTACGDTWNLEILSRVPAGSLNARLYRGFLENDGALARRLAFDPQILQRNRAEAQYGPDALTLEGEPVDLSGRARPVTVILRCEAPLALRADRWLAQKLGLSRQGLKRLAECGSIVLEDGKPAREQDAAMRSARHSAKKIERLQLADGLRLSFYPERLSGAESPTPTRRTAGE